MNCSPSNLRFCGARLLGAALLVVVCAVSANRGVAADSGPVAVVEAFHGALLAVMKEAESLGVRGRYEKLSGPVDAAFDLARMIRVASSPQWAEATEEQRNNLLAAFRRLSIATYAAQFDGDSGERFETEGQRPGPQQTVLVATRIVDADGSHVGLTYVMKEAESRWRIADVLLDNSVSQLAVRRSEYRRVLKDSGIDGLIATLSGKADDLLNK